MKTIFMLITIIILTGLLAYYNASDEGYNYHCNLVFAAIPISVLTIVDWIALEVKKKKKGISFTFIGAVILNILAMAIYTAYAFNGPSDPDTAAHMQVYAFPILLAVIGIAALFPLIVIDLIVRKR